MKALQLIFIICVMAACLAGFINEADAAINLNDYLQQSGVAVYVNSNNDVVSAQTWNRKPFAGAYKTHWPINKKGSLLTWSKAAHIGNNTFKVKATQPLLVSGKSVMELGGIKPGNKIVKYFDKNGKITGLLWSGKKGLSENPVTNEMKVSTGGEAYSRSRLLYQLPEYKHDYSDKTYHDVIVIMFEHGTTNNKKVRCSGLKSFKKYNSYVSFFWLAKGVGIIQQVVVSIEDGGFWDIPDCTGNKFIGGESFTTYRR